MARGRYVTQAFDGMARNETIEHHKNELRKALILFKQSSE